MQRFQSRLRWVALTVLAGTSFLARPAIVYQPDNKTIQVIDFSAKKPATLADIRAADAAGKWGVVQYDAAGDVTTLAAHLQIGNAEGTNSFLQIGAAERPAETLILKGNLAVKSPKPISYGLWQGQNGLLLGLPDNPTVKPVIKFACSKTGEFGLTTEPGSVLKCFSAVMTSATPDRKLGWKCLCACFPGGGVVLRDTVFSYFSELYQSEITQGDVQGCRYEYGPAALPNGSGYYRNCVFSNLDIALSDGGCLDCTAVNCRFENNLRNWRLAHTAWGIRAVDCFIGAPSNQTVTCQRWMYPGSDRWHYPRFLAQRHIVVAVKNAEGQPVAGARIAAANEQNDLSTVAHGQAVTGADGKTPAVNSGQALFLTDYVIRAGDDPAKPVEQRYTYTISVNAAGYAPARVAGVDPDQSWMEKEILIKK